MYCGCSTFFFKTKQNTIYIKYFHTFRYFYTFQYFSNIFNTFPSFSILFVFSYFSIILNTCQYFSIFVLERLREDLGRWREPWEGLGKVLSFLSQEPASRGSEYDRLSSTLAREGAVPGSRDWTDSGATWAPLRAWCIACCLVIPSSP